MTTPAVPPLPLLSAGERDRLTVLLAVVDAFEQWESVGQAARSAMSRACRAADRGAALAVPPAVHRSTRAELVRAGLAFPDGTRVRLTPRAVQITAWALWLASGEALHPSIPDHRENP